MMTFCGLSNLPVVYDQDLGSGRSDVGVLLQTHNNLLMVDRESGELVQQITGRTEFSDKKVKTYPNTMMSWGIFTELYPHAKVFIYEFNRPLDRLLQAVFEGPMEKQFSEEYGPLFPTLALEDDRLPNKEQIWGLGVGDEQAAFTEMFLKDNPIFQFTLDEKEYVIAYYPEYDAGNLFERSINGRVVEVDQIAFDGQTPAGKLQKVPLHNRILDDLGAMVSRHKGFQLARSFTICIIRARCMSPTSRLQTLPPPLSPCRSAKRHPLPVCGVNLRSL